jgi:hypothetical protein
MNTPYLTRTFDHAGYYETRAVLLVLALAVVLYYAVRRGEFNHLVIFASGVFWQGLLEYRLISSGLRGPNCSLSVFGLELPGSVSWIFQGLAEGGLLALMAFLFVDAFVWNRDDRPRRSLYFALCALILALATLVGVLAQGQPISSPRPMINPSSAWGGVFWIWLSLVLVWFKGGDTFRNLGYWYGGLVIYVLLTFEPLHLLGARYVSFKTESGFVPAPGWDGWSWMLYSHFYEVCATKIHYFALPAVFGLFRLPDRRGY